MLNFGKKIALRATKKINILTLVMSEKKILNETKNHNPPLQVKWSVPKQKIINQTHDLSVYRGFSMIIITHTTKEYIYNLA